MNNDKYFYLNIKVFFFSHAKIRMSRQPVKPVGSEFYIETGEPRKKKRVYKKDEKAGNDPCCETVIMRQILPFSSGYCVI